VNDSSLVRMANQIAANVAHLTAPEAADAVATHLRSFWTPAMRRDLADLVDDDPQAVVPLVATAVETLRSAPVHS
jgi:formate dehydrogenase subunit delta